MNCKRGDLAIVVNVINRKHAHRIGAIVTCVEIICDVWGRTGWVVKPELEECIGVADTCLRPIRPSEGQDETLSWKDVPQGEMA